MKPILATIMGSVIILSARLHANAQLATRETLVKMASISSIGLVSDTNWDSPSKQLVKI